MLRKNAGSIIRTTMMPVACLSLVIGVGGLLYVGEGQTEDLSDNEVCSDCHLDQEHYGELKVDGKKVHNPADGSIIVETHAEFACIDCHFDIEEIPHKEDVERTISLPLGGVAD